MSIEAWRVAQIRTHGVHERRGSGYLIAPGKVLTAAHILTDATSIDVILDVDQPSEIEIDGLTRDNFWSDPDAEHGSDLAIITLPPGVTAGRECPPARFARLRDGDAVITVHAAGYPLHKLRTYPPDSPHTGTYRDLDRISASIPIMANRRSHTLAVNLQTPLPPQPPPDQPSPWQGFSGAALWSAEHIIGILTEHHPHQSTGLLNAHRIDYATMHLTSGEREQLEQHLGPSIDSGDLPDIVPREPGRMIALQHQAYWQQLGPTDLVGRESELAEWTAVCANSDPYSLWQAGPWSGKSALAAWFAIHPPVGVDVAAFFIIRGRAGHSDYDDFLAAMIEQLEALHPSSTPCPVAVGAREGAWLQLLESTAAHAQQNGRRLLLLVDGLDEDDAAGMQSRSRPSIASLLPPRPPAGVTIICTSRAHPGLPGDLSRDHPLRNCTPRQLTPSPAAQMIQRLAEEELEEAFTGDQLGIDILGYIRAAEGGVTAADLSILTGAPPYRVNPFLHRSLARSLRTEKVVTTGLSLDNRIASSAYYFAHETLRDATEDQIGNDLARYREAIHAWIAGLAAEQWLPPSPSYAVSGYPNMLHITRDDTRCIELACDQNRHRFLRRVTGNDRYSLEEIAHAQNLIASSRHPELSTLIRLSVYRHLIVSHNAAIPVRLPVVWARLGQITRAEGLALSHASTLRQKESLTALAEIVAAEGDYETARSILSRIPDPSDRIESLITLAREAAETGQLGHATQLRHDAVALEDNTGTYTDDNKSLLDLVTLTADHGDYYQARKIVRSIGSSSSKIRALCEIARVAASRLDYHAARDFREEAESLLNTQTFEPWVRVIRLTELAHVDLLLAPGAGAALLLEAERLASDLSDDVIGTRSSMLSSVASVALAAGDFGKALELAERIGTSHALLRLLKEMAYASHARGNVVALRHALRAAGEVAHNEPRLHRRARALFELSQVSLACDERELSKNYWSEAKENARDIEGDFMRTEVMIDAASMAIRAGNLSEARVLAQFIPDEVARARTLTSIVTARIQENDSCLLQTICDELEALAGQASEPSQKMELLTSAAEALAHTENHSRAQTFCDEVEAVAQAVSSASKDASILIAAAELAFHVHDLDLAGRARIVAEGLVSEIKDANQQRRVVSGLLRAATRASDFSEVDRLRAQAETLAANGRGSSIGDFQAVLFGDLAMSAATRGEFDEALAFCRGIEDATFRLRTIIRLSRIATHNGRQDIAHNLRVMARTLAKQGPWAQPELPALIESTIEAEDYSAVDHILQEITDVFQLDRALIGAANALDAKGYYRHARRYALRISSAEKQSEVLLQLTQTACRRGNAYQARAYVRHISGVNELTYGLLCLEQLIREDDPHEAKLLRRTAENLARRIPENGGRARALLSLAVAETTAGDQISAQRCGDEGKELFAQIGDHRQVSELTPVVAELFAYGVQIDYVDQILGQLHRSDLQFNMLLCLARIASDRGDFERVSQECDRAAKCARQTADATSKARFFTELAQFSVELRDYEAMRKYAASALAAGAPLSLESWDKAIVAFCPELIGTLMETLASACVPPKK